MAMNKAEKAVLEALYERATLSWPPPPPKPVDLEVALEASGNDRFRGWWFNRHSKSVGRGVVVGGLHAKTDYSDGALDRRYSSGSRVALTQTRGGPWYATKLDALRAMHHAIASDCARDLARVQRLVEDEEALSQASGEAA